MSFLWSLFSVLTAISIIVGVVSFWWIDNFTKRIEKNQMTEFDRKYLAIFEKMEQISREENDEYLLPAGEIFKSLSYAMYIPYLNIVLFVDTLLIFYRIKYSFNNN